MSAGWMLKPALCGICHLECRNASSPGNPHGAKRHCRNGNSEFDTVVCSTVNSAIRDQNLQKPSRGQSWRLQIRSQGCRSAFEIFEFQDPLFVVSMLWLPVTAFKYLVGAGNAQSFSPLADAAQHLLMILVHHVPHKTSSINPYRTALSSLHDVTFIGGIETDTASFQKAHNVPSVCFADLYAQLSRSQNDERGTLMLYSMVQCVPAFRDYALVRSDVETLLLPVLRQLYHVSMGSQSQLYLLSIILLMLSQDVSFSQDVHKIMIMGPEWYKERPLGKLSLGSFMIILLLRMAHANLVSARDLYLHTNTMAALANITGTAVKLDAFAAQRFLGLIDLLSRKSKKALSGAGTPTGRDLEFRLQFYNDFLQMMLEVLNGVISLRPANNPNLVYAILQRQGLFEEIARISSDYADLVQNVQVCLSRICAA